MLKPLILLIATALLCTLLAIRAKALNDSQSPELTRNEACHSQCITAGRLSSPH